MLGYDLLPVLAIFGAGMLAGYLLTLLINKLRTGSISAGKIRQDMDDYQTQVESHFEETSEKFKKMAEHYQELYDHLSVGATTLCRPDHIATGLTDQRDGSAMEDTNESESGSPEANKTEESASTEAGIDVKKKDADG